MTINGSTNSIEWGYKLEVNEIGTSVQNRTSTIEVKTYLGRTRSRSYVGGNYTNTASVTGASTQSSSGSISYPTYINAGEYIHLKTFTFTVPNTSNPTTITISSEFKDTNFTPSYGSANGSMQLTILHLNPVIETADMVETNSVLTALSVPNTTIVQYLSKKTITLHGTAYDDATIDKYRLRHFNTNYNIPSATTYQSSNVFNTDYTTNDISIGSGKANIIQDIGDTLSGTSTDWVYVNIGGEVQKPNGIAYTKPTIEKTNTSIKRKSGGGTTLTDNKAVLNLKATYYKENDIIGNNNNIQQIGYKIWESGTSEPASYTTLTPTTSGGNITITDFEISNMVYTKTYNYKIILKDRYNYQDTIDNGIIPTGVSVWTEYKDRVDFKAITIGNDYMIQREYANISHSGIQAISSGAYTKVNFDNIISKTDNMELNDNGVKVSKSGVAIVNALIRFTYTSSNFIAIRTSKDTNQNISVIGQTSGTISLSCVIPVEANEIIYVYAYSDINNEILGAGNPPIWVQLNVLEI